jgi:hypothetical protein
MDGSAFGRLVRALVGDGTRRGVNGRGLVVLNAVATVQFCTITNNQSGTFAGGLSGFFSADITLIDTQISDSTGAEAGGVFVSAATVHFDTLSHVTDNTATAGNGGIRNVSGGVVDLPPVDNVTGNTSSGSNKNCGGSGAFTGPGAICTTT